MNILPKFIMAAALAAISSATLQAQPFARGEFNNWGTTQMNDDGDGSYSLTISGGTPGALHSFKVDAVGDWSSAFPSQDARAKYDASVDRVMASEVLEHIPDDVTAMAEIFRVLKPGGRMVVTVPRYGPERICWALSDEYHANEGGHIRIYTRSVVRTRLAAVGLVPDRSHHAHALHAPYWWLKCAVGVDRDSALVRAYHRLLVWDLTKRPWLTRTAERLLDPLFGKSLVMYADKPAVAAGARDAGGWVGGNATTRERTAVAR